MGHGHMAARPPEAVTEECHAKERLKKDLEVCSGCKPVAEQLVGVSIAVAKEEKGAEKLGRPRLRVVATTSAVCKARGVLTNCPIGMNGRWT